MLGSISDSLASVDLRRKLNRLDLGIGRAQGRRVLDGVLELTHISRPVVSHQRP